MSKNFKQKHDVFLGNLSRAGGFFTLFGGQSITQGSMGRDPPRYPVGKNTFKRRLEDAFLYV